MTRSFPMPPEGMRLEDARRCVLEALLVVPLTCSALREEVVKVVEAVLALKPDIETWLTPVEVASECIRHANTGFHIYTKLAERSGDDPIELTTAYMQTYVFQDMFSYTDRNELPRSPLPSDPLPCTGTERAS